jgi:hypothetical protein
MVDAQVVQDQEHFLVRIFDQCAQEFDQLVGIKGIVNDHPSGFAPVGDGRYHGQFFALAGRYVAHGRFAGGRITPATGIGVGERSLIALYALGVQWISPPSALALSAMAG